MKARKGALCLLAAGALLPSMIWPQVPVPSALTQRESSPGSTESQIRVTPEELKIYQSAPTVIDWTPRQVRDCPYLHKLRPAENQDQLPVILEGTGQNVALLFHHFRKVSCDEKIYSDAYRVSAVRARWDNYTDDSHVTCRYHYIIVRNSKGDLPGFSEYRTDLNGKTVDLAAGDANARGFFMLTWDFASTFLFFSPADQHADRYRYLGNEVIRGRECYVVGFAQDLRNVCRPDHFYVKNADHVVLLQGLAWIDAQTFQILRVMTLLVAPRKDIGLDSQTTTVNFFPVRPLGTDTVLWLPRDVRVEILYRGIRIRNVHQYSNFKFFRVESSIKPGP